VVLFWHRACPWSDTVSNPVSADSTVVGPFVAVIVIVARLPSPGNSKPPPVQGTPEVWFTGPVTWR
jgi:hypothetical protein